MPDISDAELAELKQSHNLLKSLYADSAVGLDFKKIVKKKYPNASVPELEILAQTEELGKSLTTKTEETLTSVSKKIDDFLADRKKEKEESEVNSFAAKIDKLSKDRGYTKEGTDKLLTLMKERGIQDPDDAAVIFESRLPKETPKSRTFSSRMHFVQPDGEKDEEFKKLMDDPEQFAVDGMLNAINNAGKEEE